MTKRNVDGPSSQAIHWPTNVLAAACALSAAVALPVAEVRAQTQFSPVQCSACPTMTTVPNFTYRSGEFPYHPENPGYYTNNLDYNTHIWGNQFVKRIEFRFDFFETEAGFDWFRLRDASTSAVSYVWGTLAQGTWWGMSSSRTLQTRPLRHDFRTDWSNIGVGFWIDSARVCCSGSSGALPWVRKRAPTTEMGVLLADRDVVMFDFEPAPPNFAVVNIALNGAPNTDFDLYMKCNAPPTATTYDLRAISSNSQEFLRFPTGSTCSTVFVAVHSYRGAGRFDLTYSISKLPAIAPVKVGLAFQATSAQMAEFNADFKEAARLYYAATAGQSVIMETHIYNNAGNLCTNCGGKTCDVCVRHNAAPFCCSTTYDWISVPTGYFAGGIAHEYLHKYMSIWDEYNGDNDDAWQCGHSVMASFFELNVNGLCTAADHGTDRDDFGGAPTEPPAWPKLLSTGKVLYAPTTTPWNYDFREFDFNDQIKVINH